MKQHGIEPRTVAIIGQGYVGLPLSMRAVDAGYRVIGHDVSLARVNMLKSGTTYVEDISSAEIENALATGRFIATTEVTDCAGFDITVITVPTPLRDGVPDLSFIEDASRALAGMLEPGATVILESTTYPGTTEELMVPILEAGSRLTAGRDFHVGYSPERIDPGNPRFGLHNTPKVVSGIDDASRDAVDAFYRDIVETTVVVSSTRVAELSKLLENTFRHVNIALVNELAKFAGHLDVNVWEAIDAASTKPFGYMKFTPGPGVGGHCLPVDPSYLSWKIEDMSGELFRFVELANEINEHMPSYVVDRAAAILGRSGIDMDGAAVVVLGLAYKKDSSDVRESPAIAVCDDLVSRGAAVTVIDGHVPENEHLRWTRVPMSEEVIANCDLVIIVTDHDNVDYDMVAATAPRVFDTRRRLSSAANVEIL